MRIVLPEKGKVVAPSRSCCLLVISVRVGSGVLAKLGLLFEELRLGGLDVSIEVCIPVKDERAHVLLRYRLKVI